MNKNKKSKKGVLEEAHHHTIHNMEEIEKSGTVYCISCRESMEPSEITEFVDNGTTGVCPHCSMDALIGDACGMTLTDTLLKRLHRKYFTYDDIDEAPKHNRHKKNGIWMYSKTEVSIISSETQTVVRYDF